MKPAPLSRYSHVLLIGSPAHFVGELTSEHFHLTHAWPASRSRYFDPNPASPLAHFFFTVSFENAAKPSDNATFVVLPDFSIVADFFCVFLSVWYGKHFKNLGFVQTNGHHRIPELLTVGPCRGREMLPFSWKPRKDLGIELNFHGAEPLRPIFDSLFLEIDKNQSVPKELELAFTAGRFYHQALDLFTSDPELAYLSLVNAGEVLAGALDYSEEELFDADLSTALKKIESAIGPSVAQQIRGRLFQVRRKFRLGLCRLVSDAFFEGHECDREFLALTRKDFESRLSAAYDLRSLFLHTGARFGSWVTMLQQYNAEVGACEPAYGTAEWKKLMRGIPSLAGLERVIRFCLLRFIHLHVAPIHPKLETTTTV